MSVKVKVTQEVLDFIELNNKGVMYWEDDLLAQHTQAWTEGFKEVKEEAKCVAKYSPTEFARILDGHYELQITPQEEVKQKYLNCKRAQTTYDNAFANGIKFAIDALNIKVKGVSD